MKKSVKTSNVLRDHCIYNIFRESDHRIDFLFCLRLQPFVTKVENEAIENFHLDRDTIIFFF